MEELWKLAEAQHAAFARWQATALDVSRRWIERRVRDGEIEPVGRAFRLRGSPVTPEQELMLRVLDGGPGAATTKRSAGWLWGVPGFVPGPADVIRGRGAAARDGQTSRWPRRLLAAHLTSVRGIPVTSLPLTIFELAGMPECAHRIGRIIDAIDGRTPSLLIALHELLPQIARRGKPGIALMRELLATRPPDRVRLTGLERRFEHLLREAGMKVPRRQINLGGHSWIGRVDYYDDDIAVIYEIDSALHHISLTDRLNDERRDAEARAAGFKEVVRITEEQVWYEPRAAVEIVRTTRRQFRGEPV